MPYHLDIYGSNDITQVMYAHEILNTIYGDDVFRYTPRYTIPSYFDDECDKVSKRKEISPEVNSAIEEFKCVIDKLIDLGS